jgi:DnaK suppressor protein
MQDSSVFGEAGNLPVADAVPAPIPSTMAAPRRHGDRVQAAFVTLAVARLERDHVSLLAALCEMEQHAPTAGETPVMRQALAAVLREELRQTQRALERAAQGGIGYCERCDAPLAVAVLLAQPATIHCASCAAAVARSNQVH